MKYFTLCADDFGYSTEVSQGILSLISIERLTATSCMTNMPDWKNSASKLIPYKDQIDIGLHFNLTEGEALSEDKKLIQNESKIYSMGILWFSSSLICSNNIYSFKFIRRKQVG